VDVLFDRVLGYVGERFVGSRYPTPSVGLLAEVRRQAASNVLARHRAEGIALASRMDRGDRGAAEAYGALAERALSEMRAEVLERARAHGAVELVAAQLHARWGDTNEQEYLDDPMFDRESRVRLLAELDSLNSVLGNYRAFFRAMEPLLAPDRATRILDLAAGHGGFALEATRIARERGIRVEITATDRMPEYLALGEEAARREVLPVRFAVQDALDLSNVGVGEHDIVVCTQSLHHFPPSMTARIFREAIRVAGRGVVLIDGCRSIFYGMLVGLLGVIRFRDRAFVHDAWVSFRRFYDPEELSVLVGLGTLDEVEARWMRPAHCLVRWKRV
jgi:SAM-dependent methyltransferase